MVIISFCSPKDKDGLDVSFPFLSLSANEQQVIDISILSDQAGLHQVTITDVQK